MSILFYALIVLLVAALAICVLRIASPDANITNIGGVLILIVAVVVIAQRAGAL